MANLGSGAQTGDSATYWIQSGGDDFALAWFGPNAVGGWNGLNAVSGAGNFIVNGFNQWNVMGALTVYHNVPIPVRLMQINGYYNATSGVSNPSGGPTVSRSACALFCVWRFVAFPVENVCALLAFCPRPPKKQTKTINTCGVHHTLRAPCNTRCRATQWFNLLYTTTQPANPASILPNYNNNGNLLGYLGSGGSFYYINNNTASSDNGF